MDEFKPTDHELTLPPRLARELKALQGTPVTIPRELEDRLLREAQTQLASSRTGRPRPISKHIVPFPKWLAAAAALVALVGVAALMLWSLRNPVDPRLDVNRDGRFDVLDAFSLARRLQQGGTPDPALDINGDGVVDDRDVETLAARAVQLQPGKPKAHG
ncbi:MAG TPA: dockerin type I domain-containing protein [Verrucomicrobiae bacterium]|nr:dockerin type I domain-containing protein [Verrucomicrobiae bacterium]